MKKLQFSKLINATAQKVYNTMLGLENIETYNQWTLIFHPTSTYEGNWHKGTKMYFIGIGDDGKRGGMISEIVDNVPFRFVSVRHYGMLEGDDEIIEGEKVEQWAGGLENYSFEENNGKTMVTIEIDVTDEYSAYFDTIWPDALNKLAEICEN